MKVEISVPTPKDGHRTVLFDAATEEGGEGLEREIATLVAGGHAVFVTLPDSKAHLPVVAYDHTNHAWITRTSRTPCALTAPSTKAVAVAPRVGG